jgi:hypothetical protein
MHRCMIREFMAAWARITPGVSGAIAASLRRVSMRFQFWSQICPPTQFILEMNWGNVRLIELEYSSWE